MSVGIAATVADPGPVVGRSTAAVDSAQNSPRRLATFATPAAIVDTVAVNGCPQFAETAAP